MTPFHHVMCRVAAVPFGSPIKLTTHNSSKAVPPALLMVVQMLGRAMRVFHHLPCPLQGGGGALWRADRDHP